MRVLAAIGVIVNRTADDGAGDIERVVLIKFDVRRAGDFHLRAGGDDLGMEMARVAGE